ncbi:regulator of chromosome condensation, RCC1 [Sandaracinus amylolyticus]|uniref:Regulator of chromosome condensation, RCC1 n=1 Tax=Sandaracinus amylolyticus TaxID=927083 RepID=A0A0F6YIL0_9BACT|nr:regulator of chromosome condensation, RCC1 [Sandaracinus amylolyticus]
MGVLVCAVGLLSPGCYLAHSLDGADGPAPLDASVVDARVARPDAGPPPPPEEPPPGTRVVQISVGGDHVCAVSDEGALYCWGQNDIGQLGVNERRASSRPLRVHGLPPIASVSAGASHTCAVDVDGGLWCWGFDHYRQLGVRAEERPDCGRAVCSPIPLRVPDVPPVRRVWIGVHGTCAELVEGDELRCWGTDAASRAISRSAVHGVRDLGMGLSHACLWMPDERVRCVGDGTFGRAGDEGRGDGIVDLDDVIDLEVGAEHACVLLADTRVLCWGYNWDGALGIKEGLPYCVHGDTGGACAIAPIAPTGDPTGTALSIGSRRSCVIDTDGGVTCWGPWTIEGGTVWCGGGAPEECDPTPTRVPGIAAPRAISAGDSVVCAIVEDGGVMCWGWDTDGQLGHGVVEGTLVREPVRVIGFGG